MLILVDAFELRTVGSIQATLTPNMKTLQEVNLNVCDR